MSFILLIIVHHFHIYHIWSYSCYSLPFSLTFTIDYIRNTILLKYIYSWDLSIKAWFRKHNSYETLVTWPHQYNLSHVIKFCCDVMNRNDDVITFISKYSVLERPRVANLADIIKIEAMFIKTTFKDSNKLKRIRNYILKCNLCLYSLV